MIKQSFFTITKITTNEIDKIKGSRFIGRIHPITSKIHAENIILNIKKEFHDATHHCFAYKTGLGNDIITRFSDDGEPSQTAGKPIMNVLNGSDLTNILIIIIRYYGGTKLGPGGLTKAYSHSAKAVLDIADKQEIEIKEECNFSFSYDETNIVMNLINKYDIKIIEKEYSEKTIFKILINKGFTKNFKDEIFDTSSGKIIVRKNIQS